MISKKFTIKEFNEKHFPEWRDIEKVIPKFVKWSNCEDEDGEVSWDVITELEIHFKNGEKISIVPEHNKPMDEEIECCLKLYKFNAEEIKWKVEDI